MVIKEDVLFQPANKQRRLHIWLPEDYETSGERYPVMYFFDGHNLFFDEDATYGKSWGLKPFLENWEKKMIVVGIECGHENNERLVEYFPYTCVWGDKPLAGRGEETLQWMETVLKPMIDSRFPTWPHREATAIAGASMGGIMAEYAAARFNHVFGKAACLSSALVLGGEKVFADIEQGPVDPDTRVYLSWGETETSLYRGGSADDPRDIGRLSCRAADCFAAHGAAVKVRGQAEGRHCEADWEKLVPEFMSFLWLES